MLPVVAVTLAALLATLGCSVAGIGTPAAVAHIALAIGILPLIMAAMIHFIPVLTRSGEAPAVIRRLPLIAQAAGGLLVVTLFGGLPYATVALAAAVDGLVAAFLLGWIVDRARRALGPAHPGWRWYAAALSLLLLALAAAAGMALDGARWPLWRLIHLHLNLLGLIGLAALGTLPLLLPTALNRPDPGVAWWLRRAWWPALAAVVLIAFGSAAAPWLAAVGGGLLALLVATLPYRWLRQYGRACLADGAALKLLLASFGLLFCLLLAPLHADGQGGRRLLAVWAMGFLLPLVSGALSQLLPVWRWPGPGLPVRDVSRASLKSGARVRAALFVGGAGLMLAGFDAAGLACTALALLDFVLRIAKGMRLPRSTR